MARISVVIPSYNHATYIAEAINSVLAQSEKDLELIIIDDGSTDNSLEVLSDFTDRRMRIIGQANQGAHAAINRGLREASGEYLAILNSDDVYHPRRLEKILAVIQADLQVGLAASYIQIIDAQGQSLGIKHGYHDCEPWLLQHPERSFRAGKDLHAALLTENYLATTSNYVFRRYWYEQVGDFRPLRYAHDWDFALRLARISRLSLIPEPLLRYRVHPSNTIRENQAAMVFEICWCLAVNLPEHLTGPYFSKDYLPQTRVERLLNSIYVYDAELALSSMLLQNLHRNPNLAMQLLQPDDPIRNQYIQYIIDRIAHQENRSSDSNPRQSIKNRRYASGLLKRTLNRIKP